MLTRMTFQGYKASADYTCTCDTCGKTLKRKVTVEHTVNPFNKNEDGSIRTGVQVHTRALAEARASAAKLQGTAATCRDCEDAPNRQLLLQMAAEPERVFSAPASYWNSPMHFLEDRKQVSLARLPGADDSAWGYQINAKGLTRAAQLKEPL